MSIPMAHIPHSLPGRTRIRIPSHRRHERKLAALARALRAIPGVREVRVNAALGSLLVLHDVSLERLTALAHEHGLFVVDALPGAHASPLEQIAAEGLRADGALRRASRGTVDLGTTAFAVLVGAGLAQVAKGHVWGPASTLWWNAIHLVLARRPKPAPAP